MVRGEEWVRRFFVPTGVGETASTPTATLWSRIAARAFGKAGGVAAAIVVVALELGARLFEGVAPPFSGVSTQGWVSLFVLAVGAATGAAAITGALVWTVVVERLGAERTGEDGRRWTTPTVGGIAGGITGLLAPVVGGLLGAGVIGVLLLFEQGDSVRAVLEIVGGVVRLGASVGLLFLLFGGWLTVPFGAYIGKQLGADRDDDP